jgi:hypothetical protein
LPSSRTTNWLECRDSRARNLDRAPLTDLLNGVEVHGRDCTGRPKVGEPDLQAAAVALQVHVHVRLASPTTSRL